MKYTILSMIFMLAFSIITAQNKSPQTITITGKVIDSSVNQPLEFASVYFENNDGKTKLGTVTDKRGRFDLSIPIGTYKMTVSFLSFKSYTRNNLSFTKNVDLGTVKLYYNSDKLNEVTVNYKKDVVEFRLDKKIYNVSKDIANSGGTAITVLENAPYVNVDGNNAVSIRNNSNIQILINGKPSGMVNGDTGNLSSIPANSIDKIEIITSKSAKNDAEGSGGIINIILKKGKGLGWNTSIESHVGSPDDDGLSTNINYKSKRVNFFSTTGYNHASNPETETIRQQFLNPSQQTTGYFDELSRTTKQANSFLTNFGADFYITPKTTLTASILFKTRHKNYNTSSALSDADAANNPLDAASRLEANTNNVDHYEYILSLVRNFKKEGEKFSVDFNYNHAKANAVGNILETTQFPSKPDKTQKSLKDQFLNTYLIQADYTLPLSKIANLETGLKSATRNYTNDYNVSQLNLTTNTFNTIGGFDDTLSYDETINAAYIQLSSYSTWSYALGVRLENTKIGISMINNPNSHHKNYTDIFPTASLSYKFKDNSVFNTSFSRSIDRPSISNINPFISFSNERFQTVGNPDLNPYYTNFLESDYYKRFKKVSMATSVFYSHSTEVLSYILENTGLQTSDGYDIYNRKPINNGTYVSIGGDLDLTYYPIKAIRLKAYTSAYNVAISKTLNGLYDGNDSRWYTQMSSLVTFKSGLKFQLKYNYQSKFSTGQYYLKAQQYVSMAFAKEVLKNQGTLTLRINDVFQSQKDNLISTEANTISNRLVINNKRQFLLSFAYRIKQKKRRDQHNRIYDIDTDDF